MSWRYEKDISGCGLAGIINTRRELINGKVIMKSIALQHDRGNGLGGGFAAYGIYPDYKDHYAFHVMFEHEKCRHEFEHYLKINYQIDREELIPTRTHPKVPTHPILWRYFVTIKPDRPDLKEDEIGDQDFIVKTVMHVNLNIDGAYVFSSGKNMGVFKGVGYPEDIGEFFCLENYDAYIWTAHNRFPTNTPGWWGGAHPFALLEWTIVHNGEISSYGINKRYLEMFHYTCSLMTDTEVVAYLLDLLLRKHNLPRELALKALSASFWKDIDKMDKRERTMFTAIRQVYGSAALNGPFAILIGHNNGLIGINDRIKLRPLVAARKQDTYYLASEESSIREVCPEPERIWHPKAGEPVIIDLEKEVK